MAGRGPRRKEEFHASMRHRTVLEYKRYRYLKLAVIIVIAAIAGYGWYTSPVGRYGGTLMGYGLGTVGALLILWLMWFGVQKRRYRGSSGSVQGWLSAHVYLGSTLIVVATLHAGFQIGWNVHTLAYALMLLVIFSGFYGLYAWLNADYLLSTVADSVIAGEYEEPLVALVESLEPEFLGKNSGSINIIPGVSTREHRASPHLARFHLPEPDRAGLPDLSNYARYLENERYSLSGYIEASRGCLHTCSHCPVVPVYGGRFFIVPFETVMADIRAQVAGCRP